MDELNRSNKRLKTTKDDHEREYDAKIAELTKSEDTLKERLERLEKKKLETAQANGNVNAKEDDLIEINAGGKIIAAKRSTLTQLKGTRFEALFSGRWDNKLQRDNHGRIFLDVNSIGFQAIVDYLNEMIISSEDNPPESPCVDDEHNHILWCQLKLFGILDIGPSVEMPDSNIVEDKDYATQLHHWLKEDGSDGEFSLLYRSTRDGLSASAFHSKCDNHGCTLTIIETTDGLIVGGYSNTPWTSDGNEHAANKAFLFALSGSDIASSCKMMLKDANDRYAVYHRPLCGPTFGGGHDLYVDLSSSAVSLRLGNSYESGPLQLRHNINRSYKDFAIKEMEVFQVSGRSSWTEIATSKEKQIQPKTPQIVPVTIFTEAVNKAINTKQESLQRAESEVAHLEESFKDEHHFISNFACGDTKDVVVLNVSGTMMATGRSTLRTAEESVLAQQFDDSKWKQGNTSRVTEWTPDDIGAWAKSIDNITDEVANVFVENEIKGNELLALNMEGLKMLGIKRTGTVCLLAEEIKLLKQASSSSVTLIEHSPYCFGKILDHLRLKHLHSQGLAEEPPLPTVCDMQKSRFEKVVRYYFPGDSAQFILG